MAQPSPNQDLNTCDDRFEKLTALIPEGSLIVRPGGRVCFSSRTAKARYDLHPGDFIDLPPFLSETDAENLLATVSCNRIDGSRATFEVSMRITQADWEGDCAFLVLLKETQDGNKGSSETLRHSEERYRAMIEGQTDIICRFRPDGLLTYANAAWCQYFGLRREDLLGKSIYTLLPPGSRDTHPPPYSGADPQPAPGDGRTRGACRGS